MNHLHKTYAPHVSKPLIGKPVNRSTGENAVRFIVLVVCAVALCVWTLIAIVCGFRKGL